MIIPKNEHKENQCLKREQIIQGNKQLLLDIIIKNFVLFRCFLYKTYICQELLSISTVVLLCEKTKRGLMNFACRFDEFFIS